jgi:cell division ATPase FtsA
VVLVGGGANLKNIVDYTKETLGLAVRLGSAKGFGGVAEHLDEPQFAVAAGLMLLDAEGGSVKEKNSGRTKAVAGQAGGILKKLFGRLKT